MNGFAEFLCLMFAPGKLAAARRQQLAQVRAAAIRNIQAAMRNGEAAERNTTAGFQDTRGANSDVA
ncbi:MAG TPA: hypothetical protein VHT03_01675 [Rhizomicrobium sp.]|jgi:hypothetical protein|nr:hypothetical protein [Rhizomicrobium sp.]